MTTSGTVGLTTIQVKDLVTTAILRCGVPSSVITTENLQSAKNCLYYYLVSLGNKGINLWTIEKTIIGLLKNQITYQLPLGTIDTLGALYRVQSRFTDTAAITSSAGGVAANTVDSDIDTACTQTSANGNLRADYGSATTVVSFGVLSNVTRTYTLVLEGSDDDATWTTVYTPGATSCVDRVWQYWDIDSPRTFRYFRVRETGGAILDLRELALSNYNNEYPVTRENLDNYINLPNKTMSSNFPTQYWLDRKLQYPTLYIWPVVNTDFLCMVVWRHRQIQDIGAFTNTVEIPDRWAEALITNLAARLIFELPKEIVDFSRAKYLVQMAAGADIEAGNEERDKSSIDIDPGIRGYTR